MSSVDEVIQAMRVIALSKLRKELERIEKKDFEFFLKLKLFLQRCERKPE